jgi:hypothetical protein
MPYLGDYLGQILSEITIARLQADLETIRLAELYASHPLLRTMPVPHMRLPEVNLEIPVLIKEAAEPRTGESARGGVPDQDIIIRGFRNVLDAHLSRANFTVTRAESRRLDALLRTRLAETKSPPEISVDVHRIAADLITTALRFLEEARDSSETDRPSITPSATVELTEAVRLELLKLRAMPPRMTVLVTSAELREMGSAENVVRLRLKVSEEGVEWTTIDIDGIQRDRLVPE